MRHLDRLYAIVVIAGILWLVVAAVWAIYLAQRYASLPAG